MLDKINTSNKSNFWDTKFSLVLCFLFIFACCGTHCIHHSIRKYLREIHQKFPDILKLQKAQRKVSPAKQAKVKQSCEWNIYLLIFYLFFFSKDVKMIKVLKKKKIDVANWKVENWKLKIKVQCSFPTFFY